MDRVVKITSLKDKSSDFQFWMSKSFLQRLQAIETLRSQYIKYQQNAESGLQRISTVVNRKQS
jgi:hypothetical protein